MKNTRLNDNFFSRLETLSLNLRSNLSGYFGGEGRSFDKGQIQRRVFGHQRTRISRSSSSSQTQFRSYRGENFGRRYH